MQGLGVKEYIAIVAGQIGMLAAKFHSSYNDNNILLHFFFIFVISKLSH